MLTLRDIKKSYVEPNGKELQILDVPKYHVGKGQQTVLIGSSGCGKTTLLHVIAGISRANSGTIHLGDVEVSQFSEAGRDRVRASQLGYVFQTFNLLAGFSALENVLLGMTFGRGKKDVPRAKKLLDRVGLSKRMSHKPAAMSVGEQQRVAVARALANKPRLLLADEPTANVDPANQQQVIDLIREACFEESIALVLVTHSMEVANQFDRVDRLEEINQVVERARASQ